MLMNLGQRDEPSSREQLKFFGIARRVARNERFALGGCHPFHIRQHLPCKREMFFVSGYYVLQDFMRHAPAATMLDYHHAQREEDCLLLPRPRAKRPVRYGDGSFDNA